jgi:hypothetical protein
MRNRFSGLVCGLILSVGVTEIVPSRTKASANLKHTYSRVFATSLSDPAPRMLVSLNTNSLFAYNTRVQILRTQIDKPNTVVVGAGDIVTIHQQKHTDVPGHVPYAGRLASIRGVSGSELGHRKACSSTR